MELHAELTAKSAGALGAEAAPEAAAATGGVAAEEEGEEEGEEEEEEGEGDGEEEDDGGADLKLLLARQASRKKHEESEEAMETSAAEAALDAFADAKALSTHRRKGVPLKALPPARGQVTWNNHAGRMLAFQQQVRDQTNSVVAAHVIAPAGAGGVSKAGGGMRQRKSSAPFRSLL